MTNAYLEPYIDGYTEPFRDEQLKYYLNITDSGTHLLPLQVESTNPSLCYKAIDATATTWPARGFGGTLTKMGAGTVALNNGTPAISIDDDSILPVGAAYYQDAGTTNGNVGTDDFLIRGWLRTPSASTVLCAKRNAGVGYQVGVDAALKVYAIVQDASGATTVTATNALLNNKSWNYIEIYFDRDSNCKIFINEELEGTASIAARALTLDSATAFTVLADSAGAGQWDGGLSYIALYNSPTLCAKNYTNYVLHQAQLNWEKLNGTLSASASSESGKIPIRRSRATAASMYKVNSSGVRKMFWVGRNVMRVCSRLSATGIKFTGILGEPAATNLFTKSQSLAHANWTKVNLAAFGTPAHEIFQDYELETIIGDANNAQHGLHQSPVLTAANYATAFFVAKGTGTGSGFCYIENATIANGRVWFNLTTGAVATTEAGVLWATIEPWGDGVYRVKARFLGTAAGHQVGIFAAEADNDTTYIGDGATVDIYAGCAQIELGNVPTSYIYTDVATAVRNVDLLDYGHYSTGAGPNAIGDADFGLKKTISCSVLMSGNVNASASQVIMRLGYAFNDVMMLSELTTSRIQGYIRSNNVAYASIDSAGVTVNNNEAHTIKLTCEPNSALLYKDGIQVGSTDTSVDPPWNISRLEILHDHSDAVTAYDTLINNIAIYDEVV